MQIGSSKLLDEFLSLGLNRYVGRDAMASVTQESILDAAEQVFASCGYDGAAMREIANKAGVNQALLHYHFETKDNLYERVVERRSSAINNYRIELLDALRVDGLA